MKKVILFSALMIFVSSCLLTGQEIIERRSYKIPVIEDSTNVNSFKTISIDKSNNLFIGMDLSNDYVGNNQEGVRFPCLLLFDSDLN